MTEAEASLSSPACLCCAACESSTCEGISTEHIMTAVRSGDLHYVRHATCCLRQQVMEVADEDGMSPIHIASQMGHIPILKFLLRPNGDRFSNSSGRDGGMKPNVMPTNSSNSGLRQRSPSCDDCSGDGSAGSNSAHSQSSLNPNDNCKSPSWSTTASSVSNEQKNAVSKMTDLIEDWPSSPSPWANKVSHRGHTALHWAAVKGHTTCVVELLKSGFDINAMSSQGATPLQLAVAAQKVDVARVLARSGADIKIATLSGSSPQNVATYLGNPAMTEALRGAEERPQSYF